MQEDTDAPRADDGFADFFTATWPWLYRVAVAITADPGSAEDALQSTFARVYADWSRIGSVGRPEAYVRRMVVNEILSTRRRGWWARERPREHLGAGLSVPSPETGVVDRDALWVQVQALPLRQRAVVVLRYYEDLSEQQIAEVLGCSRGTVKSQASAALASLRRHTGTLEGDHS